MKFIDKIINCFPKSASEAISQDVQVVQNEVIKAKKEHRDELQLFPSLKSYKFSKDSLARLKTCHPDIQTVFHDVIKVVDIKILEGARPKAVQDQYFMNGASKVKYPNSYHNTQIRHIKKQYQPENISGGHTSCSLAVDVVPYPIDWENLDRFHELSRIVKLVAKSHNIHLDNGWDLWGWDFPHWQLTTYRIKTKK